MAIDEPALQAALLELETTPGATLAGMSKRYGISRTTLRRRREGKASHATGHQAA